jgi:hypothetical protein
VLDNWRISGISTFGTGSGEEIEADYDPSFEFRGGGEACGDYHIVGDPSLPRGERSIDRWFNTAAYAPLQGRGDYRADCGNGWEFRQPGWHNHDLTFFKDIRLKGNQQLQYRWEIYNLFDQVQYQTVNVDASFNPNTGAQENTTFGKITAARTERRMQMSIRYIF